MAISAQIWLFPQHRDIQTGLWCPVCFKPSGFELPMGQMNESGATLNVFRVRQCYDCRAFIPPGPVTLIGRDD